jgi:hypothetical protein
MLGKAVLRYCSMLDDKVQLCFRDLMEAELRPRDYGLRVQVQAADRSAGGPNNGRAIFARIEVGRAELIERAKIIWDGMKRCISAFQQSATSESMKSAINEQLRLSIVGESNVIRGLLDATWAPKSARAEVLRLIFNAHEELIKRYQTEASFYVHELMNPPKKPDPTNTTVNIQTNVGSVAVGADAQAHSHVEIAGNVQLVQSLEKLRATFEQSAGLSAEQLSESLSVVADAIAAARETKPNRFKLAGLLAGVASAASFLSGAPDAYQSVKAAALAIGIQLP